MRQGCISLGEVQCDDCHRIIPHSERYLLTEGRKKGVILRLCVDCCLNKGYADYKKAEKGEQILTFFLQPKYGK